MKKLQTSKITIKLQILVAKKLTAQSLPILNIGLMFTNIQGQLLHVKIGSDDVPASTLLILLHEKILRLKLKLKGIKAVVFCTHHLVNIEVIKLKPKKESEK